MVSIAPAPPSCLAILPQRLDRRDNTSTRQRLDEATPR
jgi:hypothetical protein